MKIIIPGVPAGKGRPKFSTVNGHAVAYTPKKTANYENLVKLAYQEQAGSMFEPSDQLRAEIKAFFPIPKSTTKRKRAEMQAGGILHTKKPDADNIAKAILDALNGVAYYDDAQVCELFVKKLYSDQPRAELTLNRVIVLE